MLARRVSFGLRSHLLKARRKHTWLYKQGSIVAIDLESVSCSNVEITSAWIEHCEISGKSVDHVTVSHDGIDANICPVDSKHLNEADLMLTVPEQINLFIRGRHMNIVFKKKILGNLTIICDDGDIHINKHRGEDISINSTANITVTTALEGNINLVGHSVMAQMIHSNRVNITGDTVKINALYSQSAKIVSAGSVSVGMLQGHSEIDAVEGPISIPKLIGSIEAKCRQGDTTIYIDELADNSESNVSAQGTASIDINPKIDASFVCSLKRKEGTLDISHLKGCGITSSKGMMPWTGRVSGRPGHGLYDKDNFTSGKINVKQDPKGPSYLEAQTFFAKMNYRDIVANKKTATENEKGKKKAAGTGTITNLPNLTVSGGNVKISSKSWMDRLKEKHGVDVRS